MSVIDPKGSRQESEAMAIIRAHRAQNLPDSSPALAAQPPPLIVLPIPGFWKSPDDIALGAPRWAGMRFWLLRPPLRAWKLTPQRLP